MKLWMRKMVRELEAKGWRVRNGGWPSMRAAEARWDFCRTKDTLFPMTPAANEAARQALSGEPITARNPPSQRPPNGGAAKEKLT
jgi:hypothetical protein